MLDCEFNYARKERTMKKKIRDKIKYEQKIREKYARRKDALINKQTNDFFAEALALFYAITDGGRSHDN